MHTLRPFFHSFFIWMAISQCLQCETSWELCKCKVKGHYQILILVRWWEAERIVGCLKICLCCKINLSSLRRLGWKTLLSFLSVQPSHFLYLSPASLSSHPFSLFCHSVSLSIQSKIKQLTMMIKVTGPIKLHMKWLSTLSQHLWQRKNTCRIWMEFLVTCVNDISL